MVEGIVVMKKIKYILCACLMMASLGMEAAGDGSEGGSEESVRRNECDGYADC